MFCHTCKSLTRGRFIEINDRRTRNHADRKSRARSLAAHKVTKSFRNISRRRRSASLQRRGVCIGTYRDRRNTAERIISVLFTARFHYFLLDSLTTVSAVMSDASYMYNDRQVLLISNKQLNAEVLRACRAGDFIFLGFIAGTDINRLQAEDSRGAMGSHYAARNGQLSVLR